jgi:hypothetical protein
MPPRDALTSPPDRIVPRAARAQAERGDAIPAVIDPSDAMEYCRVDLLCAHTYRPILLHRGPYRLTLAQAPLHTRRKQSSGTATVNQLR